MSKEIFSAVLSKDGQIEVKLNINPNTPLVSYALRLLNLEIDNGIIGQMKPQESVIKIPDKVNLLLK